MDILSDPTPAIMAARPIGESRHLHALRVDMRETYCRRLSEFRVVGHIEPSEVTCCICRRALKKAMTGCTDCGCPGKGALCPACRLYQKRNPGQRRGHERKPAYCHFGDDELAALYRRYQNNESMQALAQEVGVCLHTLKARFREAGYRTRNQKAAALARKKRDQALAPRFPRHRQAFLKPQYVSRYEASLLDTLEKMLWSGKWFTLEQLAKESEYASTAVVHDALYRLRERGFIEFGSRWNKDLKLMSLALERETRSTAQERMEAVYQPAMNSGDLARAAGVSAAAAIRFIKRKWL